MIGNEAYYSYQVFNQAIVVPETIDAIRALSGIETVGRRSIEKTDRVLGIVNDFLAIAVRSGEPRDQHEENAVR